MVKPRKRRFHSIEMIRTQTEQFLELFSRTLNAVVLTECTSLNKSFLHLMHALCFCVIMLNYLVCFHVFINT